MNSKGFTSKESENLMELVTNHKEVQVRSLKRN